MPDDHQSHLTQRIRALFMEYESYLGAEAIIQAVANAFAAEVHRMDDNGIYIRAAKYEAAEEVLRGGLSTRRQRLVEANPMETIVQSAANAFSTGIVGQAKPQRDP